MTVSPAFASLPRHRAAFEAVLAAAAADPHVLGVVLIGSFAAATADEVSDLDVVLVVAEGEFDTAWQRRSSYSADALRSWDVGPFDAPIAAHKWMTPQLVLVECLFAPAGSGARLGEPFLVVAGAASVMDSLRRRGTIPRAEIDSGEFTGDPAEWLYDALKLCLRGDPGAAFHIVDRLRHADARPRRQRPMTVRQK